MPDHPKANFAANIKSARLAARLSQSALARKAGLPRLNLVRAESGQRVPDLNEAAKLAYALQIPWQRLITGRLRPAVGLRGIAFELFHYGITDLRISDPHIPGAFRRLEQVLAIALTGDRPDPRVIEAIPVVLARHKIHVPLSLAFADVYDQRIRSRLAWLCDITLALDRSNQFPLSIESERHLSALIRRVKKPTRPDSLGIPAKKKLSPIWSRWNITYAGTLQDFSKRCTAVAATWDQSPLDQE